MLSHTARIRRSVFPCILLISRRKLTCKSADLFGRDIHIFDHTVKDLISISVQDFLCIVCCEVLLQILVKFLRICISVLSRKFLKSGHKGVYHLPELIRCHGDPLSGLNDISNIVFQDLLRRI